MLSSTSYEFFFTISGHSVLTRSSHEGSWRMLYHGNKTNPHGPGYMRVYPNTSIGNLPRFCSHSSKLEWSESLTRPCQRSVVTNNSFASFLLVVTSTQRFRRTIAPIDERHFEPLAGFPRLRHLLSSFSCSFWFRRRRRRRVWWWHWGQRHSGPKFR